jgi:hypothetical protein
MRLRACDPKSTQGEQTGHQRGLRPGHALKWVTWELVRAVCFLDLEHRKWVKPVEQNDPALESCFLIFSELLERTQTSGSSQGIGDRAGSGVTRDGQTAVLVEHSSEDSAWKQE